MYSTVAMYNTVYNTILQCTPMLLLTPAKLSGKAHLQ